MRTDKTLFVEEKATTLFTEATQKPSMEELKVPLFTFMETKATTPSGASAEA